MERKKTWKQKVKIVNDSFLRAKNVDMFFARSFYENLFFLNPKVKDYFKDTDFEHQNKALLHGLEYMLAFLNENDDHARSQVKRIAESHSHKNMNIHPHDYYYWVDALVMTLKESDPKWYDDMQYYWREVIFFPVSFIISQYFHQEE